MITMSCHYYEEALEINNNYHIVVLNFVNNVPASPGAWHCTNDNYVDTHARSHTRFKLISWTCSTYEPPPMIEYISVEDAIRRITVTCTWLLLLAIYKYCMRKPLTLVP